MSLILDALKRSEQERANNRNNPAVNMDFTSGIAQQKKHSPWIALFVILFLLALAAIIYLLLNRQTESETAANPAATSAPVAETINTETAVEDNNQATMQTTTETAKSTTQTLSPPPLHTQPQPVAPVPLSQQIAKKPVIVSKPDTGTKPQTEQTAKPVQTPSTETMPEQDQAKQAAEEQAAETQTTEETDAPDLTELPDDVQMMFLKYEINTHFYSSKPGRSFALINMKKYREGKFIEGSQMKIEKITPEGVVVDYGRGTVLLRSY